MNTTARIQGRIRSFECVSIDIHAHAGTFGLGFIRDCIQHSFEESMLCIRIILERAVLYDQIMLQLFLREKEGTASLPVPCPLRLLRRTPVGGGGWCVSIIF